MRNYFALAVLALPVLCHAAGAPWKPDRNVEVIANTSPGTGSDTTARLIHKLLLEKKLIDVTAAVVNKIGGGGTVGLTYLSQHAGNGHYLMVTSPTILTNHITGKSTLNYTDTTPLAQLGSEAVVFSVRTDSPLKTARDLADRLKADPGAVSIAVGNSAGSHNHIAAALIAKSVGANVKKLKVVAFNGSTEGITALLGGHIDVVASPASGVLQHFLAGKIRILAVSSEKRLSGALAAVPTWKEAGIPVVVANWRSVAGPKGLSDEQIAYWDGVFARLAQLPDWKQELAAKLEEDTYSNSRDTRKLMDAQYTELSAILTDLGLAK
jgi:putative tricarboxylic transport membrane protein